MLDQMLEQGYINRRSTTRASSRRCPSPAEIQAPQEPTGGRRRRGLLHELGAAAGDRTLRRPARLRRRPARSRRRSTSACSARPNRPINNLPRRIPKDPTASLVAIENSTGRGPRDGRRAQLRREPVQPRHRGRAPARLLVQGVRPRRRARARHLARLGVDLQGKGLHRPATPTATKSSSCTTTKAPTPATEHAARRDGLLGQLHLRRSRPEGRHREHRRPGPPDGHHHADLDQPRDDDRRPDRRRDAAGHGARLRDDRPRRPARERHARRRRRPGRASRKSTPASSTLPDGSHRDVNQVRDRTACSPP